MKTMPFIDKFGELFEESVEDDVPSITIRVKLPKILLGVELVNTVEIQYRHYRKELFYYRLDECRSVRLEMFVSEDLLKGRPNRKEKLEEMVEKHAPWFFTYATREDSRAWHEKRHLEA